MNVCTNVSNLGCAWMLISCLSSFWGCSARAHSLDEWVQDKQLEHPVHGCLVLAYLQSFQRGSPEVRYVQDLMAGPA